MALSLAETDPWGDQGTKSQPLHVCKMCKFVGDTRRDYDRHINTVKHKRRALSEEILSDNPYFCEECDFRCVYESKRIRHIASDKHQQLIGSKGTDYHYSYLCDPCDVICRTLDEYSVHIKTVAHKSDRAIGAETATKIYYCEFCELRCCKKSTYTRHLGTGRHAKNKIGMVTHKNPSSHPENIIVQMVSQPDTLSSQTNNIFMSTIQTLLASQSEKHDKQMAILIQSQTAQTEAHAAHAAEQTRLLIEAISTQGPQCITNNHNNTTNNQFNLNVFLNEDCKNAFTFKDVIESIVCTVDDLDRLIVDGYAATVIRKILESMQDMTITERPIHCTDLRRNTVCVKNATGWEKGEAALKRLNNSLYFIGKKLSNVVPEWRETYPDHFRGTDSRRNQYHTLIVEVLKVDDVKLEDRNVGIICKSLVLDRKTAKAGIM